MTEPVRRGCVYWASLDKRRPVLVVSSDPFNTRASYATVVPGTTRLRPLVTHVKLRAGEGGVARPTMLMCEHLQTVPRTELGATPLGPPLSDERMDEVKQAVLLYLGMDEPPPSG